MAIVCIKIGENEAQTYGKFDRISKSMDIIEILPRMRDKDGKIMERTMGTIGDKHFLGLNVDMSSLTDDEFKKVRNMLREEWVELSEINANDIDDQGTPVFETIARRLRKVDLSKISNIGISTETTTKINDLETKKRAREDFDAMTVNKYSVVVPFESFAKCVVNKETNETLETELSLTTKTLKDSISTIELKFEKITKDK